MGLNSRSAGPIFSLCAALLAGASQLLSVYTRDSGVYRYGALRMLEGSLPYRDFWDHKPPGIFLLNALGFVIAGGADWGICLLGLSAIVGAALLGYHAISRVCGPVAALAGACLWLAGVVALSPGINLPELFALPLSFAALALAPALAEPRRRPWPWLLLGSLAAGALLLKPNLASIHLVVALVAVLVQLRGGHGLKSLLGPVAAAGSTLGILTIAVLPFALSGALPQLFDAVIVYNIAYSGAAWPARLRAAAVGLLWLSPALIPFLALAGWTMLATRGPRAIGLTSRTATVWAAVAAFPLEIILASTPGWAYQQHFLPWLPACSVLAVYPLYHYRRQIGEIASNPLSRLIILPVVLALPFVIPATPPVRQVAAGEFRSAYEQTVRQAAALVHETTTQDDGVLVWGSEAEVYLFARRSAPTRFIYHGPLFTTHYTTPEIIAEFMSDLERRRPALIVDTSATNPRLPPIDPGRRAGWRFDTPRYSVSPELAAALDSIAANYAPVGAIAGSGWVVYAPRTHALDSPPVLMRLRGNAPGRSVPMISVRSSLR